MVARRFVHSIELAVHLHQRYRNRCCQHFATSSGSPHYVRRRSSSPQICMQLAPIAALWSSSIIKQRQLESFKASTQGLHYQTATAGILRILAQGVFRSHHTTQSSESWAARTPNRPPTYIRTMPKIFRLTLFKIPDAAHIQEAVDKFSTLAQYAIKVSVLSHPVCPGEVFPMQRDIFVSNRHNDGTRSACRTRNSSHLQYA